jgi:hypothetical protein
LTTDALKALILKQAQDFRLRRQWHITDLIQENGAAVTLLELSDVAPVGAGKCTLLVSEQLTFQEMFGDGGTIDCQERRFEAIAVLINGPRGQFLPRSTLAGDQHQYILVGDAADRFVYLAHRGATSDDRFAVELFAARLGLANRGRIARPAIEVERVADDLFDEWESEIQQLHNPSYKADSKKKLADTKKQFATLRQSMKRSEQSLDPVLATLKDQVVYLKHNLNAQSLGTLKGEAGSIQKDVERLTSDIRHSIAVSNEFIGTLEGKETAVAH